MRIGLVGPAGDDVATLHVVLDLLMDDPEMDRIIYLGLDGAADTVVGRARQNGLGETEFLDRAVDLATSGTAADIGALLAEDKAATRLELIHRLPAPPSRAVEMLDTLVLLCVHDKSILDEEDIESAHLIAYGKSDAADLKRFGPRIFFSPGPVARGRFARIELTDSGDVELSILDLDGGLHGAETIQPAGSTLVVTP